MSNRTISLALIVLLGLSIMAIASSASAEETYFVFTDAEPLASPSCGCGERAVVTAPQCSCVARAMPPSMHACACTTVSASETPSDMSPDHIDGITDSLSNDNDKQAKETEHDPWTRIFGAPPLQSAFSQEVKHLQIYLNAYIRRQSRNDTRGIPYLIENGIFDDSTENALRQFQIDQCVSEVGVVGDETKAKLYEVMGDLLPSPRSITLTMILKGKWI